MFKRILFATDFSPHAEIAKRVAMRLAQADDKQLWAVAVLEEWEEPLTEADEPPMVSPATWERELEKEQQALERQEERLLDRDVAEMEAEGIRVHKILREGDPAEEIVAAAQEIGADLIVVGSHSRRNIWDIEMGNTAAKVAKKAPCPVLVVSHRPPHPGPEHERILFATDFSPHAEQAFKIALTLAKETEGRIWLVSVIEPGEEIPMPPGFVVEAPDAEVRELEKELRADVEAKVRRNLEVLAQQASDAGVKTEISIRHGHIAKEIRKAAVDVEADVIVMGTHSRRSLWDKLLGNTSQNVAQHASCPVLLVSHTTNKRRPT
ncbi:MAG TPA: universal stress protein [Chloroflexi bacterium]|nr:universal stress protein [Chloroflexota bacterium]